MCHTLQLRSFEIYDDIENAWPKTKYLWVSIFWDWKKILMRIIAWFKQAAPTNGLNHKKRTFVFFYVIKTEDLYIFL